MAICESCGGVIGVDCFNPQECAWITEQQEREKAVRNESYEKVLSNVVSILKSYSSVHMAFKVRIKHGENDSWSPNHMSMKEKGWEQAVEWVLELLASGGIE